MKQLVIYVIGINRSGTTLLDYLLSCHPDAISVGELHNLRDYFVRTGVGERRNWKCNCGKYITDCNFWKNILKQVSFNGTYITRISSKRYPSKLFSLKKINRFIKLSDKEGKLMAENTWNIYNAIFKDSGKQIIVDSSKSPLEAFFLYKYRRGNIRFLLMERDIWEIAYSKKKRVEGFPEDFKTYMALKDESIYRNIFSTYRLSNYIKSIIKNIKSETEEPLIKRINYLDLAKYPKETIVEICSFLAIDTFIAPIITNNTIHSSHTIHGSPSRREKSLIKPDERWKEYYKKRPIAFLMGRLLQRIGS